MENYLRTHCGSWPVHAHTILLTASPVVQFLSLSPSRNNPSSHVYIAMVPRKVVPMWYMIDPFPRGGSSSHCIPATSISYSRTMTYATLKPNSEGQMEELYKLSSSYSEILTLTCWWYSTESAVTLTNSDHVSDENESRETDVLSVSSLKVWSRRVR